MDHINLCSHANLLITIITFVIEMSIIGTIYEDVTTDVLGKMGSWQWLVTFVSSVLMVPSIFNQYEDMFMIHPTDVICIPQSDNEILNTSLCSVTFKSNVTDTTKCYRWHVKLMWLVWIKKSWLVFCDHDLKLLTTAIICRFGLVFGCIIFGFVADSFGRKIAIIVDLISSIILCLLITFCDSEAWFRLLIFLRSLLGSANIYMGLLLVCEISSNGWRSFLCTIVSIPRLIGTICMIPLANVVSNMETYSFITCLFAVISMIAVRWCPESPQWLLYNRKINKAENILKKAAEMNRIILCDDFKIRPVNHRAYNCLDEPTTCVRVFSTHNIRTIIIITCTFWTLYHFIWSCLYVNVYKDEHIGYLLLKVTCGFVLFGCLSVILLRKVVMRQLLLIHIIITGVTSIGIIFFTKGIVRGIVCSIGLSSGVIVHVILMNMTPRLFAINIRASVVGCCFATGQLGSIVSYIVIMFHPNEGVIFALVKTCIVLALAVMCLLLPKVDGRELPDVMQDMDYYSELSKPLRWVSQKTGSTSAEEIEMRIHSFGSTSRPGASHSETRLPARRIGLEVRKTLNNIVNNIFNKSN